mmetsp:Transcript_57850/g.163283  ORF Transcript_57850/g.163283 Transcript_57850/m.163283 type:complete len:221 (+) Transcript_57850:1044-1706(+)
MDGQCGRLQVCDRQRVQPKNGVRDQRPQAERRPGEAAHRGGGRRGALADVPRRVDSPPHFCQGPRLPGALHDANDRGRVCEGARRHPDARGPRMRGGPRGAAVPHPGQRRRLGVPRLGVCGEGRREEDSERRAREDHPEAPEGGAQALAAGGGRLLRRHHLDPHPAQAVMNSDLATTALQSTLYLLPTHQQRCEVTSKLDVTGPMSHSTSPLKMISFSCW